MTNPSYIINSLVKPELEDAFGTALTARIILTARDSSNCPIVGMTSEDCYRLIEAICSDDRVVSTWGNEVAQERMLRWKNKIAHLLNNNIQR
jgi:hypothetical protein